jgi:hypothetical protein
MTGAGDHEYDLADTTVTPAINGGPPRRGSSRDSSPVASQPGMEPLVRPPSRLTRLPPRDLDAGEVCCRMTSRWREGNYSGTPAPGSPWTPTPPPPTTRVGSSPTLRRMQPPLRSAGPRLSRSRQSHPLRGATETAQTRGRAARDHHQPDEVRGSWVRHMGEHRPSRGITGLLHSEHPAIGCPDRILAAGFKPVGAEAHLTHSALGV